MRTTPLKIRHACHVLKIVGLHLLSHFAEAWIGPIFDFSGLAPHANTEKEHSRYRGNKYKTYSRLWSATGLGRSNLPALAHGQLSPDIHLQAAGKIK
eukprot:2499504-Amphidinium_carterae.2